MLLFLRKIRRLQIRMFSRWAVAAGAQNPSHSLLAALRAIPGMVPLLVGYRRPSPSLGDVRRSLTLAEPDGHLTQGSIDTHLALSEQPRPSDFAAFYHLARHITEVHSVFDCGGNFGNLYYYYTKFLDFPPDIKWQVHDLTEVVRTGQQIARERSATALTFTTNFDDATGVDLLLASGSMHYFEKPLSKMVAGLMVKPRHVLINRTPLTDGPAFATVQDAGSYRVACMVYNRAQLIRDFADIGYQLKGGWQVAELSLRVPFHPDFTVLPYSGLMFELIQTASATISTTLPITTSASGSKSARVPVPESTATFSP
jgi:putative methyltransferase (TIGR04325 family)